MKTKVFQKPIIQARLELGPFDLVLDDYVIELRRAGYPDWYFENAFRVIIRFSDWVGLKHIPLTDLTQTKIDEFLQNYSMLRFSRELKMLRRFIQFLRQREFIPPEPVLPTVTCPMEKMLYSFERYLHEERGLSSFYIYQQVRTARAFLGATFCSTGERWDLYTAQVIGEYFTKLLLKENGTSEARDASRLLCQFFKFLFIRGETRVDLSSGVPRPANWSHTRLPIYLERADVHRLLESCDQTTESGVRDYAILMLLSRLGVRGGSVKNLNLEDLHWREGAITVRGKGKESKMPMPNEVGEAIGNYLKNFRSKTTSRSVFVSLSLPHQGFKGQSVSGIVRSALERAKIDSAHKGSHLLRHTVANECLKGGANLREIGQLLGHERCATTSIYAKVDFARLSQVTASWAGGAK